MFSKTKVEGGDERGGKQSADAIAVFQTIKI
jgi:hypothetical protein